MDYSQLIASNLSAKKREKIDVYNVWKPTLLPVTAMRRICLALVAARPKAKPTLAIPAE